MRFISHDGSARVSIIRETVTPRCGVTCAWCGGLSKQGKLFLYGYIPDDALILYVRKWSKPFCSIGCFRRYY